MTSTKTTHRLALLSLAVASAFALSGCGGSTSTASYAATTPNNPTTVVEPPAPQAVSSMLLMVANNPDTQQAKVLGLAASSSGAIPRTIASYGARIGSMVSSADGGRVYLLDGANVLHTIDASSGAETAHVTISIPLQGLQIALKGMLLGIAYSEVSKKNELYQVDPSNGALQLLSAFNFDGDAYIFGSFISDPSHGFAYAISSKGPSQEDLTAPPVFRLYAFGFATGQLAQPVTIQRSALDGLGMALSTNGRLLVSTFELSKDSTVLSQLDTATGEMKLFASAPASEAKWRIVSMVSDVRTGVAYLATESGRLYKLDLNTGDLSTITVSGPLGSIELLQLGGPGSTGFVAEPVPGNTDDPVAPPPASPPVAPPPAAPSVPPPPAPAA
jgi:hypothetical protein